MTTVATSSIAAQNTFTTPVKLDGYFNVSVSGNFVGTVTLQRSDDNSTWVDVETFVDTFEGSGFEPESIWYRIGIKTSEYTSGTAVVRLGRGDFNVRRVRPVNGTDFSSTP
jgi:hypothetical protein